MQNDQINHTANIGRKEKETIPIGIETFVWKEEDEEEIIYMSLIRLDVG